MTELERLKAENERLKEKLGEIERSWIGEMVARVRGTLGWQVIRTMPDGSETHVASFRDSEQAQKWADWKYPRQCQVVWRSVDHPTPEPTR